MGVAKTFTIGNLRAVACVLIACAVIVVAAEPGSVLWQQSIPGTTWEGTMAGLYAEKYFAAATLENTELMYYLTVLDGSSGKILLRMKVAPMQSGTEVNQITNIQVSSNGIACATASDGSVACGNVHTGQRTFAVKLGTADVQCESPTVSWIGNHSIAVSCKQQLYVVSLSGKVELKVVGNVNKGTLVTTVGSVGYIIADGKAGLVAYDLATQQRKWSQPALGTQQHATIACASGTAVVALDSESVFRAYHPVDGTPMWHSSDQNADGSFGYLCTESQLWYTRRNVTSGAKEVVALGIATGSPLLTLDGTVSKVVLVKDQGIAMHVNCSSLPPYVSNSLKAYNSSTGALLWEQHVPLSTCNTAGYVLGGGQGLTQSMPVSALAAGTTLAVPNRLGVNFFSAKTGDRITDGGKAALQFSVLEGVDTGIAAGGTLYVFRSQSVGWAVHVEALAL